MVIALLAVLGVNLIVIVVLLAGVVTRKRWVMRRPGLFRAVAREASGEVRGLHPKWRRGYGRWVHDILVWTKGPFFFSNELLPADGTTEECPAAPGEVKRLGVEPGRPHPPIGSGERRGRGERSRPHPPPRGLRGTGRPGGRVRHPRRRTTMAAALTLGGVVLLGACGSGGSSPDAGPTRTASRPGSSPSLARPTEARTSASAGVPTHSAAGPTNPAPTAARTTTIPPKPTSASEPVEASTVTSSVSVSGSKEVAVTEQDTSQVTDWWPVALLAVLVLLVLGVWARMRHSRRSGWDADLGVQSAECRWAVSTLAPAVVDRTVPVNVVAAQWTAGQQRMDGVHLALVQLGATAPTSERGTRAGALSIALDELRQALSADVSLRTVTVNDPASDFGLITSYQAVERARQAMIAAIGADPART